MDQVSIRWLDIAQIVLASGVVSAFVSQGLQWLKESRKDAKKFKAEAALNAIGLVGILDRYIVECHRRVKEYDGDPTLYLNSNWCSPPDLDISEARLEFFSAAVLSRLAWLKTEKGLAHERAIFALEHEAHPEGYQDHCISITGYSGYEIAIVAARIRKEHALPELSSGWALKERIAELKPYWQRAKNSLQ